MAGIISKTFGGLTLQYYFRNFVFGLAISAGLAFLALKGSSEPSMDFLALGVLNTFLYPYSRFVYESVVRFIQGGNVFFSGIGIWGILKIFSMLLCWAWAIFIAPIGLAYLYWHHSRAAES